MPYSDFNAKKAQEDFQLKLVEKVGIFSHIEEAQLSDHFSATLEENIPLAVSINTEKARSELIVANVLVEIRKIFDRQISFFSGIEFNVDKSRNLNGFCDFIISLSPEQLFIKSPIVTLVEAKNENIMSGLGQCIAEMVAARLFNENEGNTIFTIYGAITSGIAWKFLKLEKETIYIDLKDYSIDNTPGKVIGVLSAMVAQKA